VGCQMLRTDPGSTRHTTQYSLFLQNLKEFVLRAIHLRKV
jgi:hypothetical protein